MGGHADFLDKARESLAGAKSELANGRHNNAANRAYYACFQAAVHALIGCSVKPPGADDQWRHDFVQARFTGDLINRRKRYSASLRSTLEKNARLRESADYNLESVSEKEALRAVERAEAFVTAVAAREGAPP